VPWVVSEAGEAEFGNVGVDGVIKALRFLQQSSPAALQCTRWSSKEKSRPPQIAAAGGLFLEASRIGEMICNLD